jgi:hypothetical protein
VNLVESLRMEARACTLAEASGVSGGDSFGLLGRKFAAAADRGVK